MAVIPTILWLADPACQDSSVVGNKAAVLAQLYGRRYQIPDGFCVTIPALAGDPLIWHDAVSDALRKLKAPWVVRSSSTAEDSQSLAYPGLFVTVIDLSDARSAFEAIERVYQSVHNASVLRYTSHHGIATGHIKMAVLVQSLVPATAAGVAFSRDPVSEEPVVVIEANYGIGETVVDGSVTPDSVTINRDGSIVDRHLGSKRQKVITTTLGTRVRRLATSPLERSSSVLSDRSAHAIAELATDLEVHLGFPVDMEWALVEEDLYLLQARPITKMSGVTDLGDKPNEP